MEDKMKLEIYTMNSFAKTRMGGNPAGVVLNSDSLLKKENSRKSRIFRNCICQEIR